MVHIEISLFLADLCVVRKSHWVPDRGQEAKTNELEEIQSRTCFNQRLDIFFSFGSGAAILLEALNRKRQAVERRASVVIQGRSQLSQEERQKERAARRIPQCAIRQSARSHTGQLAPKRHTWRKRQSHRLSHLLSPSRLCQLSRVFAFSAFFLSFVSLPASFPLHPAFTFWVLLHRKGLSQTCHCHHGSLRSPFPRPRLHLHRRSRSRKSFAGALQFKLYYHRT